MDSGRFLDAPEIHRPVDVKVIDKAVDRIVEVFQKKPVAKVRFPHRAPACRLKFLSSETAINC